MKARKLRLQDHKLSMSPTTIPGSTFPFGDFKLSQAANVHTHLSQTCEHARTLGYAGLGMDKPANTRISCRWRQNSGQVLYAVSVFSFNHLICLLCHMQFSSSACVRHREYYLKNLCRFALFLLRSGSKISLVRGFSRSFSWARVQETLTQMSKFVEHAPIALLPISAVRRANPEQIVEPHLWRVYGEVYEIAISS